MRLLAALVACWPVGTVWAQEVRDGAGLDEIGITGTDVGEALVATPLRTSPVGRLGELPELDGPPMVEPIALPTGESKSGVTPQALSVPSDGGSVEGLGESFSPLLSSGYGHGYGHGRGYGLEHVVRGSTRESEAVSESGPVPSGG